VLGDRTRPAILECLAEGPLAVVEIAEARVAWWPASATFNNEIVVDTPIAEAFAVVAERFDDFKPREHSLHGAPITGTVFEIRAGGHIFERAEDGSECDGARSSSMNRRHGWSSAGTSARPGKSNRTPTTPARSKSASPPDGTTRARVNSNPQPRPPRTRLRSRARRHPRQRRWPLYLQRYASLFY
jgi:hypothetical protein